MRRGEQRRFLSTRIDLKTAERRKRAATQQGVRIAQLDAAVLQAFMRAKPWENNFDFAVPAAFRLTGEAGWLDCKLQVGPALIETVKESAKAARVSAATFAYSALIWGVGRTGAAVVRPTRRHSG